MLLLPWSEFYLLRRLNYNLTTLALLNRDTMQVLALVKTISCDFVLSFQMLNKPPVWLFISRQMSFEITFIVWWVDYYSQKEISWIMLKNEESFNLVSNCKPYSFGNRSHTVYLSKIRKYPTKSVTNFSSKNMLVPLVCTVLWNFFLKTVASSLFSPVPPNWCDLVNPTLPKVRP